MIESTIDPALMDLLRSKFNVIDTIEFLDFDHDYSILEGWLNKNYKESFDANDKLIVTHYDTDYYIDGSYGIILHNLFALWRKHGIPFFTMIINTNHFGIKKEIDHILRFDDPRDRPLVIETLLNTIHYPIVPYENKDINVDEIECHALSLCAGSARSHRQALYCHTRDIPSDRLAISIGRTP